MSLCFNVVYIVIIYLTITISRLMCQTPPSFRIIAPQTICKQRQNDSVNNEPQALVVGFQPRDGIKLSYNIRIFFKTTSKRVRSQRNTLLIWKAVRSLENRINVKERLQISQQNMMSIHKTEVEPGAVYMFHVVGVTDAGEVSKEQVFSLKYIDGILERNETTRGVNFVLIGSEDTVASITYIVTARISFCIPRYDYYLRWKMLGLDEEFQDVLHTTGSVLKIPPNALTAGKKYQIQASLMQSNLSTVLAQDSLTVQVMKKGFYVYITPVALKIGTNKPAIFEVYIQDFDNICDELSIFWDCTALDGEQCPLNTINSINVTKIEYLFPSQGRYEITVSVKLGDITKSTKAEVTIDPTIYVSYEFSHLPNLVPAAGQSIEFSVLIINLIPNCKAGWSSAQEDGFVYVRADEVGEGFAQIEVKDLEKAYLSEIADYENSTVNKEIILYIPPASGKWIGLKGDANYKFRLDTVCPGQYIQNAPDSVNRKIVSSLEFVIYANSPPSGGKIMVKPRNGTALSTVFEISSENAKDLLLDSPLTYEFIVQVEQYNISLGKFYEFKAIDTQLPYSEYAIQITCQVCDIRQACSYNYGPTIKVDYTMLSRSQRDLVEKRIVEAFKRNDITEGHNMLLMAALTYKNTPNSADIFDSFKSFATNFLLKEIDKQYESPTEKYYISKEDILSFISLTKINLEVLGIKNAATLEKLLDLLDLIVEDENFNRSSNIEDFQRKKRDIDNDTLLLPIEGRSIVDAAYVKMNLNLIQQILDTLNEQHVLQPERTKIFQKIPNLAVKMCNSDLITRETIYTPIAAVVVEKMTGNHLLEKNFTIVNYFMNDLGYFQVTLSTLKTRTKYYCAAFIQFREDLFSGDMQVVYNLQIIDLATANTIVGYPSKSVVAEFKLPKLDGQQNACLMRSGEEWSSDFCSTKYVTGAHISCNCKGLGFLKTGKSSKLEQQTPKDKDAPQKTNKTLATRVNQPLGIESDFSPEQPSTVPSTTVYLRTSTITMNLKTQGHSEPINHASILNYVLPAIGLITILLGIGAAVVYRRRKRHDLTSQLQGFDIMSANPRQPQPGIKYAKFYDEHLMTGDVANMAT